jgi:hypothetical protein
VTADDRRGENATKREVEGAAVAVAVAVVVVVVE